MSNERPAPPKTAEEVAASARAQSEFDRLQADYVRLKKTADDKIRAEERRKVVAEIVARLRSRELAWEGLYNAEDLGDLVDKEFGGKE